jgi:hypothetical protein
MFLGVQFIQINFLWIPVDVPYLFLVFDHFGMLLQIRINKNHELGNVMLIHLSPTVPQPPQTLFPGKVA